MDALIQEQKEMDTLERLSTVQSPKETPLAASPQQLIHPIQPTWFKGKIHYMLTTRCVIIKHTMKKNASKEMYEAQVQGLIEKQRSVCFKTTFTERQCEFGQRTGSRSLIPVIVPMYLQ